ncbi:MAG TPA: DinB family protein [Longimicrobium sp.]
MHPQLQALLDDFTAARARLHRLVATVPADRFAQRPPSGGWSPAECVAHLNLTARGFIPDIQAAIEQARARGGPAPARYRRGIIGALLVHAVSPGKGMKVKTAPSFVPNAAAPAAELAAEFDRWQDAQMQLVRTADGLPIDRVKVASPFDKRVKYNAFAALSVLPRHQHRHLLQAEQAWAAVSGGG